MDYLLFGYGINVYRGSADWDSRSAQGLAIEEQLLALASHEIE
jgi:hypothetical protein